MPDDAVGKPDVNAGMQYLGAQGVNNALIEAGPGLVTSILAAGAVDRIYWTQSNHILGANALAAVDSLGTELANKMAILPEKEYFQSDHRLIGDDRLVILTKSCLNRRRQRHKLMFTGIITAIGSLEAITDKGTAYCASLVHGIAGLSILARQ